MEVKLRVGVKTVLLALTIVSHLSALVTSSSPEDIQILNAERRVCLLFRHYLLKNNSIHTGSQENQVLINQKNSESLYIKYLNNFWPLMLYD